MGVHVICVHTSVSEPWLKVYYLSEAIHFGYRFFLCFYDILCLSLGTRAYWLMLAGQWVSEIHLSISPQNLN